jgi:ribosome-associated protein
MRTPDTVFDNPPERPSKSQRKREMHQLQELGAQLALLSPERLARLPISERLQDALEALRPIRSREARRRQLQYVGRVMRREDEEAIAAALAQLG